jgi:hypothetical protein
MASGIIGNDVPRKGLRVRVPCPPLDLLSADVLRHVRSYLNPPRLDG